MGSYRDSNSYNQSCGYEINFTVHVVNSFIKGRRKSGVISIKYSRDITKALKC